MEENMKKKKSKKNIIILIIVIVVVALAVVGFLTMRANNAQPEKIAYNVIDVEKGTIEVKVKGAGAVAPLYDETVHSSLAGKVQEVFAENGDVVKADDIIIIGIDYRPHPV